MNHRIGCWLIAVCLLGWAVPLHGFDVNRVERSVVRIINQTPSGIGTGSGTVINAGGDVLTNHHVTAGGHNLFVISEFSNGEKPAQIVWESPEKDLALIRAPGLDLPAAPLFSGRPEKGESVYSLGYPGAADLGDLALDATLTSGVLGRIFPSPQPRWNVTILQHDADINSGNSGGPLFDNCGRVIGVNTAGPIETSPGINWSSHIAEAITLLRTGGIDFSADGSPCMPVPSASPGSSDTGTDEHARQTAQEALGQAGTAKQQAQEAQAQAAQATQAVEEVRGGVESATQTAQEAQTQAAQATRAVAETKQASRLTNTFVALVAVVTLLALGLALRKPRQEIIRVAGQIAAPLSQLVQSVRPRKPAIALTGFDSQGQPVSLRLHRADLDRQQGGFTVGRHPLLVDRVLNGERLSRRHARFSGSHGSVFVEDLNSSHGTRINGTACPPFQPVQIRPGDMVEVGDMALRVSS